jgi:hypothetical protein
VQNAILRGDHGLQQSRHVVVGNGVLMNNLLEIVGDWLVKNELVVGCCRSDLVWNRVIQHHVIAAA